jgi:hypothetical protein
MSLALTFSDPYYTGESRSTDVPGRYHCSIGGHAYMIDTARLQEFTRRGIPLLREQADNTGAPGEQTLSPEELWRRSQDDWSHGAGQTHLDRKDSDNQRFRSSKGIDVWTKWQMGLLPDTTQVRASTNTGLELAAVGSRLYVIDGAALAYSTNGTTFTAVTGLPAAAPTSIATNGFDVWTAHGASGVYATNRTTGASTSYNAVAATLVGYVKGRLMAANGASLYNITASGTAPAALYTQPNTDWRWTGFAEGSNAIYAAGFSGDKSLVYRTAVKQDGTALDIPIVAGELPDGEIVRSISGYLGFILLGTDKGVRFAAADASGNLTIGALIRTTQPVHCFEGQDRFVWFGWSNYDGTSTGLGRLDLTVFISSLTPGYASDLMVTGQGVVRSVVTFGNKLYLTVDGLGVYAQSVNLVASGTLDTGLISYGLPDLKTAVYLDVKLAAAVDTNNAYLSVDGKGFALVGQRAGSAVAPFVVGEMSGETFEIRHELVNTGGDATGPTVTRWTLRSYPRPSQGEQFFVPVLLHERVETRAGSEHYDPTEEFEFLVGLRESKRLVTYQIGSASHTVTVDDALFQYSHLTKNGRAWNGTALLRLKSYAD